MQLPQILNKYINQAPTAPIPDAVPSAVILPTPVSSTSPKPDTFRQVIDIYLGNSVTLALIILIPVAAHLVIWEFGPFKKGELVPLALFWVLVMLILQSWGIISALQRWLDRKRGNPIPAGSGFRLGQILSTGWVIVLSGLLVLGGLLLFIIPGIYILVYLSLAIFMPVCRHTDGFSALLTSQAFLKGHEKLIVPHLVVSLGLMAAPLFVALTITSFFGVPFINSSLWGAGLLLMAPLIISYMFLIFQKYNQPEQAAFVYRSPAKHPFVWIAVLGLLLSFSTVLVLIAPNTFWKKQTASFDEHRLSDKQVIKNALSRYYNDIKSYPLTLDTLKPHYLKVVPFDPRYQLPYQYESTDSGQKYRLCIKLEEKLDCFTSSEKP